MTKEIESTVESEVYEISFIFDNTMSEDEALAKSNALKDFIATLGGSFVSEETPYLRELAYEMIRVQNNSNKRFNEGFFGWIKFEIGRDVVSSLDAHVKNDENIVRYLIVKTLKDNTVYTKRAPVIKAVENEENKDVSTVPLESDANIDTTKLAEVPASEAKE